MNCRLVDGGIGDKLPVITVLHWTRQGGARCFIVIAHPHHTLWVALLRFH